MGRRIRHIKLETLPGYVSDGRALNETRCNAGSPTTVPALYFPFQRHQRWRKAHQDRKHLLSPPVTTPSSPPPPPPSPTTSSHLKPQMLIFGSMWPTAGDLAAASRSGVSLPSSETTTRSSACPRGPRMNPLVPKTTPEMMTRNKCRHSI
jgi:hypothetical protein